MNRTGAAVLAAGLLLSPTLYAQKIGASDIGGVVKGPKGP
jgi:hypothetical protein